MIPMLEMVHQFELVFYQCSKYNEAIVIEQQKWLQYSIYAIMIGQPLINSRNTIISFPLEMYSKFV